jgi:hypothetical protein
MRGTRVRLVVLLAATSGATALLLAPGIGAAPAPDNVIVVNGSGQPVPTSIVGTPSVQITGTPTVNVGGTVSVQTAREPYQAFVAVTSTGGEECSEIPIPSGKRVWIESFSADAFGAGEPSVYVRVDASVGGGTSFVRPVKLGLSELFSGWTGHAELLLHAGSPAPGPRSFTIHACTAPATGASAQVRAFVSGWMENT